MKPAYATLLISLWCTALAAQTSEALLQFISERPSLLGDVSLACLKTLKNSDDILLALPPHRLVTDPKQLPDIIFNADHEVIALRPQSTAYKAQIEVGDKLLNPHTPSCAKHSQPNTREALRWQKPNSQKRSTWLGATEPPERRTSLVDRRQPKEQIPVLTLNHIPANLKLPPDKAGFILDLRRAVWFDEPHFQALQIQLKDVKQLAFIISPWTSGQAWQLIEELSHAPVVADKSKAIARPCLRYQMQQLKGWDTPLYECKDSLPDLSKRFTLAKMNPYYPEQSMVFVTARELLAKAKE